MDTQQVQLKVSPLDQLYLTFKASERTINKAKKAIKDRNKAVAVKDVEEYFNGLLFLFYWQKYPWWDLW